MGLREGLRKDVGGFSSGLVQLFERFALREVIYAHLKV